MTGAKPPRGRSAAAQRLAAQRAEQAAARARAERKRKRLTVVGAPIAAVIVIAAILVGVKLGTGGGGPKSGQTAAAASTGVVAKVTGVPASTLNAIGAGTIKTMPKAISGPPLTADGKPRVLYAGAEYCPFCATERWSVVLALSRFGTFHNLGQTASSPSDVYPSTATLSFHGASYTSGTISFTGVEMQSNKVVDGKYATLDKLSAADQKIFDTYNAPPYVPQSSAGAIPFVDIGGKYLISGASYDPQLLHGKTHEQIADALADPNSSIAKAVDGTANVITAAVCASTKNAPASVCQSAGVKSAAAALNSGG